MDELMAALNGLPGRESVAGDEEGCVAHARENAGVGDGEDRRAVEQDEVVFGAPAGE